MSGGSKPPVSITQRRRADQEARTGHPGRVRRARLATGLALAAVACGDAEAPEPEAALAAGEKLYEAFECAGCHESAAIPGLVVIPLRDLDRRFSEESLASLLAAPPAPMPRFDLDPTERRSLARYLRKRFRAASSPAKRTPPASRLPPPDGHPGGGLTPARPTTDKS